MNSSLIDVTEWALIPAAVLLLAAWHRLDLLVIVAPVALLAAYAVCGTRAGRRSGQRKI